MLPADPAAIAWLVLVPLTGAVLASLTGPRGAFTVAALASWTTLGLAGFAAWEVRAGGVLQHQVGGWGAPLGIALRVDGLAAVMLCVVAIVGLVVTSYASRTLDAASREERGFAPLWLFALAALNALLISGDVFNLYVTLELSTLAAVGLIALAGDRAASTAALRYLLLAITGSMGYLLGVALLYGEYAALDMMMLRDRLEPGPATWAALVAMTVGLSVKAALFPLHAWLAPAHARAPTAVSALLSAVIVKGPFYVLVRLWLDVFPDILPVAASQLIGALGAGAVVWGSLLAIGQPHLKALVAWSTVAQIGYLFLLFPLSSMGARSGGVLLVLAHAAAKASMFLAAGSIRAAAGHDELARLRGISGHLPLTCFALGIAGTSLMGMPPSGGFAGKWLLVRAALEQGQWWWAAVLLVGGLLGAGYVIRVLRSIVRSDPGAQVLRPVPRGAELATLALALVALALGLAPQIPLGLLEAWSAS